MRKFTYKLLLIIALLVLSGASTPDDLKALDYQQAVDIALQNNDLISAAEKMVGGGSC